MTRVLQLASITLLAMGKIAVDIVGVVHACLLIAKVGQFSLQLFTFSATGEAALKAQGADDPSARWRVCRVAWLARVCQHPEWVP